MANNDQAEVTLGITSNQKEIEEWARNIAATLKRVISEVNLNPSLSGVQNLKQIIGSGRRNLTAVSEAAQILGLSPLIGQTGMLFNQQEARVNAIGSRVQRQKNKDIQEWNKEEQSMEAARRHTQLINNIKENESAAAQWRDSSWRMARRNAPLPVATFRPRDPGGSYSAISGEGTVAELNRIDIKREAIHQRELQRIARETEAKNRQFQREADEFQKMEARKETAARRLYEQQVKAARAADFANLGLIAGDAVKRAEGIRAFQGLNPFNRAVAMATGTNPNNILERGGGGSGGRYGRANDSLFNEVNHRTTNLAQLGGVSLYGLGTLGAGVYGAKESFSAYAEMKRSELALTGIVNTYYKFLDAQGKSVSNAENLNRSIQHSHELYDKMAKVAPKANMSVQQLEDVFTANLGALASRKDRVTGKGYSEDNMLELISKVSEAVGVFGPKVGTVEANLRPFSTGILNRRSGGALLDLGLSSGDFNAAAKSGGPQALMDLFEKAVAKMKPMFDALENTPDVKIKELDAAFTKMKQTIGAELAPVIIPFMENLTRTIEKWVSSGAAKKFGSDLGNILQSIGGVTTKLISILSNFNGNLTAVLLYGGFLGIVGMFVKGLIQKSIEARSASLGFIGALGILVTGILALRAQAQEANASKMQMVGDINSLYEGKGDTKTAIRAAGGFAPLQVLVGKLEGDASAAGPALAGSKQMQMGAAQIAAAYTAMGKPMTAAQAMQRFGQSAFDFSSPSAAFSAGGLFRFNEVPGMDEGSIYTTPNPNNPRGFDYKSKPDAKLIAVRNNIEAGFNVMRDGADQLNQLEGVTPQLKEYVASGGSMAISQAKRILALQKGGMSFDAAADKVLGQAFITNPGTNLTDAPKTGKGIPAISWTPGDASNQIIAVGKAQVAFDAAQEHFDSIPESDPAAKMAAARRLNNTRKMLLIANYNKRMQGIEGGTPVAWKEGQSVALPTDPRSQSMMRIHDQKMREQVLEANITEMHGDALADNKLEKQNREYRIQIGVNAAKGIATGAEYNYSQSSIQAGLLSGTGADPSAIYGANLRELDKKRLLAIANANVEFKGLTLSGGIGGAMAGIYPVAAKLKTELDTNNADRQKLTFEFNSKQLEFKSNMAYAAAQRAIMGGASSIGSNNFTGQLGQLTASHNAELARLNAPYSGIGGAIAAAYNPEAYQKYQSAVADQTTKYNSERTKILAAQGSYNIDNANLLNEFKQSGGGQIAALNLGIGQRNLQIAGVSEAARGTQAGQSLIENLQKLNQTAQKQIEAIQTNTQYLATIAGKNLATTKAFAVGQPGFKGIGEAIIGGMDSRAANYENFAKTNPKDFETYATGILGAATVSKLKSQAGGSIEGATPLITAALQTKDYQGLGNNLQYANGLDAGLSVLLSGNKRGINSSSLINAVGGAVGNKAYAGAMNDVQRQKTVTDYTHPIKDENGFITGYATKDIGMNGGNIGDYGQIIASVVGGNLGGDSKSGSSIGGTLGSALGSAVPGLGTVVGGILGTLGGGLIGSLFGKGEDPATAAYRRKISELLTRIDKSLRPVGDYYRTKVNVFSAASAYIGGRALGVGDRLGAV